MRTVRIKWSVALAAATLALLAWNSELAAKYKEGSVEGGGSLRGAITLAGAVPDAKRIKVTKDNEVCGDFIIDEALTVNKNGGIVNAVVEIEGITTGKKWDLPNPFRYDQSKCAFSPHIMIVMPRAAGAVKNSDPVKHNVHTISKGVFNVNKTVAPGKSLKVKKNKIKKAGIIRVKCDLHKWMGGWWYVPASPYVTLTDAEGRFSIENIPPGKYKVKIWQEKLGETVREVVIEPGATTNLTESLAAK